MRLTLRTLLAYLDGLLEPPDAVEMGKRIEESKFATELVHRIRTRMRLLRLGAPKIEGKGIGVDPNSVAEYLDNSLSPDRALEIEKVCLESDVHLAEVASCHQILAAVLDGAAQVDASLRLRMYGLIQRGDAPPVPPTGAVEPLGDDLETAFAPPIASAAAAQQVATPATAPAGSLSARWLPLAITLAVVFLVVIGGLRVLGPFNRAHPLAGWLGVSRSGEGLERQVAQGGPGGASVSKDGEGTAKATGSVDDGSPPSTGKPAAGVDDRGGDAVGKDAAAESPRRVGSESAESGAGKPAAPGKTRREPTAAPMPDEDVRPDNGVPPAEIPGKPAAGKPVPGESPAAPSRNPPSAPDPLAEGVGEGPVELGRFLSEEHVMARRNPEDNLWYRLARGTRLLDGDHLVSLPVYRPQLLLTTGVQVMLVGEASLRLKGLDKGETPEVTVEYGRLLLASSGRPGANVRLNLGGEAGTLRFADVDAEVALEVHRFMPAGEDPLTTPAQAVISISARKGKAAWKGAGETETVIGNGERGQFIVDQPPVVEQAAFPFWSSPPSTGGLDRSASEHLAGFVRLDRPVTLSLGELAEFRRMEVRSLAARCLGVLGSYDALWNELSNEKQYSYWDEAVGGLQAAIARSPEEASEVRKSIEGLRKRHSGDLFRLLRGYDAQQLAQGGAAQLVDFLEHDDLDVRVLAFENLRRITESTHNYRPEKPAEARKIQIQEWRKQLKEGRIAYKTRRNPS